MEQEDTSCFLALLLLHPSVLEPDLHLSLVELQAGGDLHAPCPGQVLVEVELLLQLRELLGGEVGADDVLHLAGDPVVTQDSCGRMDAYMNG